MIRRKAMATIDVKHIEEMLKDIEIEIKTARRQGASAAENIYNAALQLEKDYMDPKVDWPDPGSVTETSNLRVLNETAKSLKALSRQAKSLRALLLKQKV